MLRPDSRWVLAFDGSCATCRKISSAVAHACDGKLDVLPLDDDRVRGRRDRVFDRDAPWAPTLPLRDAVRRTPRRHRERALPPQDDRAGRPVVRWFA